MEKKIELFKHKSVPEIDFKNLEYYMPTEKGVESIAIVAYTMVGADAMNELVSKIFSRIDGIPNRENFMREFWKFCSESFYDELN